MDLRCVTILFPFPFWAIWRFRCMHLFSFDSIANWWMISLSNPEHTSHFPWNNLQFRFVCLALSALIKKDNKRNKNRPNLLSYVHSSSISSIFHHQEPLILGSFLWRGLWVHEFRHFFSGIFPSKTSSDPFTLGHTYPCFENPKVSSKIYLWKGRRSRRWC